MRITSRFDERHKQALIAEAERLTKANPKYTGVYRCRERRKGERSDKPLLPMFTALAGDGVKVSVDTLGAKAVAFGGGAPAFTDSAGVRVVFVRLVQGYSGWGYAQLFEDLEVELPSGLVIPAYRTYEPGHDYIICQTFSRKATAVLPAL